MMPEPSAEAILRGARNLLINCARAGPGDRVLLVGEAGPAPYFDPALCTAVAGAARGLGMTPEVVLAEPVPDARQFPAPVRAAMARADRTIFFTRLGDRVRFDPGPGQERAVMSYTLTLRHLAAPFATADFGTAKRLHDALVDLILGAERYRITAACGTDLSGRIARDPGAAIAGFALELFPVMIFPPVLCPDLEGTLTIGHFVTSSSTRAYEDSVLIMDAPVRARIEAGRIAGLDGPKPLVGRLVAQLDRAAALTGGDPMAVNSWHTGINPNTFFDGDPYADLELWGTVAYGSPRYTHLHAAGRDPGDAAFHLMDATISFDGRAVWEAGRLVFLDWPEIRDMIPHDEGPLFDASTLHSIGI